MDIAIAMSILISKLKISNTGFYDITKKRINTQQNGCHDAKPKIFYKIIAYCLGNIEKWQAGNPPLWHKQFI